MKIHDISMNINQNMQVYGNNDEKKPKIINRVNHQTSKFYETSILMDMHTGTHIDAPLHMIKDGATMESYDLSEFIKKCKVLDLTHVNNAISKKDLEDKEINSGDFLLLKTKNSYTNEFSYDFIYLDKEGAQYLLSKGVVGVGTDGLGIERSQKDHETHKILLGNNIMIIEGLRLKDINKGTYQLIAFPLKIDNVEAAPCRAVLIEE